MERAYECGDVVWLKSNGPPMTVTKVLEEGGYLCRWFAGEHLKEETFPGPTLKPVDLLFDLDALTDEQIDRIANGEDVHAVLREAGG